MTKRSQSKNNQTSRNSKTKTTAKVKTADKILNQENLIRITGFFLVFISLFLTVSFISFIINWLNWDRNEIINDTSFFRLLFDQSIENQNLGGKLGQWASIQMIKNGFGIATFFLIIFLFAFGVNLSALKKVFPLLKLLRTLLMNTVWLSLALGFFLIDTQYDIFAGFFGYQLNKWLISLVGTPGTGLIILFILLSITQIRYKFPLNFINWAYSSVSEWYKNKIEELAIKKEEAQQRQEEYDRQEHEEPEAFNEDTTEKQEESEYIRQDEDQPFNYYVRNPEYDSLSALAKNQKIKQTEETPIPDEEISKNTLQDIINKHQSHIENQESNAFNDIDIASIEQATIPQQTIAEEEEILMETNNVETDEIIDPSQQDRQGLDTCFDPKLDLSNFQLPPIDLMTDYGASNITVEREELEENKNRIVDTLNNYGIKIDKIRATIGPTVTLYEIIPAPGVRISKIKNLEDDIALSLSALGIRIIAPIPGKGTIGIEVPNQNPETVSMRSVIASKKFQDTDMALPLALGKTISNDTFVIDLAKMPHMLMAGATGQGKSVGINAILASLLYKKHPAELKFVLVDPKKVELSLFSKIENHYLAKLPDTEDAIITDTSKVVSTLNSLCIEMDTRYELLKNALCRNIKEYNKKFIERKLNPNDGHKFLPYIVLVIDEFADLIMTAGKEVEMPIARLAQLARAIGIHLIIATQRPSTNIITGIIKANFPARISFRVISTIDSRTILDSGGANNLIGKGDMLLSTGSDLTRIQCAFIDTPEVEKITDYIGEQMGYPSAHILPEYSSDGNESGGKNADLDQLDALFEDAARIIVQTQQGSTSMLQRKLKLGYNRAGRIIDQLEAIGIVGPSEGSKAREVLVKTEEDLNMILNNLN
ncbi:MAG: DNA translocase FtsK [Hyphomicrobiales bacterium]